MLVVAHFLLSSQYRTIYNDMKMTFMSPIVTLISDIFEHVISLAGSSKSAGGSDIGDECLSDREKCCCYTTKV